MREIKFRIRDFFTGGWKYYNLLDFESADNSGGLCWNINSIGQYTGLKDKNGKEIYEGDIVILSNVLTDGDKKICKAIMDGWQSLFESVEDGFYCVMGNTAQNYREVIGNIYENPVAVLNNQKDRSKDET